ncbi:helix-turn-helix domain-containing protein [Bradyrhizobium sp. GCM10027634]|uniref:helix-turn-helix domain-containing protein n=1 Tax=unclassified Bradyrhizobium TaxID=2631580 RepID=UPI00345FE07B
MKGGPTEIDRLIGKNIRVAREAKGLSQDKLSRAIGKSYQQLQKYESAPIASRSARFWRFLLRHSACRCSGFGRIDRVKRRASDVCCPAGCIP